MWHFFVSTTLSWNTVKVKHSDLVCHEMPCSVNTSLIFKPTNLLLLQYNRSNRDPTHPVWRIIEVNALIYFSTWILNLYFNEAINDKNGTADGIGSTNL